MYDEAWVRRLALHAMQSALLLGQQGHLCPGDRDGWASCRRFELPGPGLRGDRKHSAKVEAGRLRRGRQEEFLAVIHLDIDGLWHVAE